MHDDGLEGSSDAGSLGVWELVGIGTMSVGTIVVGLVLGSIADRQWDTAPVFVLVGIAIGIVGAIVGSWLRIKPFLDR